MLRRLIEGEEGTWTREFQFKERAEGEVIAWARSCKTAPLSLSPARFPCLHISRLAGETSLGGTFRDTVFPCVVCKRYLLPFYFESPHIGFSFAILRSVWILYSFQRVLQIPKVPIFDCRRRLALSFALVWITPVLLTQRHQHFRSPTRRPTRGPV